MKGGGAQWKTDNETEKTKANVRRKKRERKQREREFWNETRRRREKKERSGHVGGKMRLVPSRTTMPGPAKAHHNIMQSADTRT